MEEKKKYRFADEKEQLKRVNSFLATGYTIFYIVTQTSHLNKCLCTLKIQ